MFDVVIVGGGIGGATLGLTLARRGLSVAVAEQNWHYPPQFRGEFLQPRSLEILDHLQVLPAVQAVTTPVHRARMRNLGGGVLADLDYTVLPGPHNEGRNGLHRDILAAVMAALEQEPRVVLFPGAVVQGLVRGPRGQVEGVVSSQGPIRARFVVGADGRTSVVRDLLGIQCRTFQYPGMLYALTVELPAAIPPMVDSVFGVGESATVFPLPHNRARLYLAVSDQTDRWMAAQPDKGLAHIKLRLSQFFPGLAVPIAQVTVGAGAQRLPAHSLRGARWVADGAALLGDAAHCVSPVRGQGMNLAIADAWELAGLLARLIPARRLRAADLAPYEARRRRSAAFIQADGDRTHRLLTAVHPGERFLRNLVFGSLGRAPRTMHRVLAMYAGLSRPPVLWDHLFVPWALLFPRLDGAVARVWGRLVAATSH